MYRLVLVAILSLAAFRSYGADQVQMTDIGLARQGEDDFETQLRDLQRNISDIWTYIYELRNAVSQHLTHLRQHQIAIENMHAGVSHHDSHSDQGHSSHGSDDHHHGDEHGSDHSHTEDQHGDDHSDDHHHSHSHSHSRTGEHYSHSDGSHNGDHGSEHGHSGEQHSHSHSGEQHSHGGHSGEHHSHDHSKEHTDSTHSHDHSKEHTESHGHGEEGHHEHDHKDSHEKDDKEAVKQHDHEHEPEATVEPKIVPTDHNRHHHNHHRHHSSVPRRPTSDPLRLFPEHSHHHDHSSDHRSNYTVIPKYSEYNMYDFATCNMQPNRAIPDDMQQEVKGHVSFWQKKTGGPMGIHVRLQGFSIGDHGDHGDNQMQMNEAPVHEGGHRHGFHVHTLADLSNGCQSTGPHYNPKMVNHGSPRALVRHVGDLGNIECDDHGVTNVIFSDEVAALTGQYAIVGRSLVIHANVDDYGLKPNDLESLKTGNAGTRIACCIIEKVEKLPLRLHKALKSATQYQNR